MRLRRNRHIAHRRHAWQGIPSRGPAAIVRIGGQGYAARRLRRLLRHASLQTTSASATVDRNG
ncbi:hypothetical protein C7S16_6192 [Burkholderia thailandensis]|uniref:Uncharacterized protein n=1 Tax=Burkholderia thailandensis TaxID=57975 RepID=A0AAW9CWV1_BURTH|nr:hypothetical protein [Burkholderia thailandensis]MDW9253144.1 hypothetical protein [Burkholderia thailandensis]